MSTNPAPPPERPTDAARTACHIVELLEVLWERGRGTASLLSTSLSTSQLRALRGLERKEGINLRTLGDVLDSAPSSVSRLCHRLEALGFVERTRSSVSRRELELRLTDQGRNCLAELRARRESVLMAAIEAMAPSSRIALLEGLDGFLRAMAATDASGRRGDAPVRHA